MADLATKTLGSLTQFYNQDAKFPVCELNTISYGDALDSKKIADLFPEGVVAPELDGYFQVSDKLITKLPEITYIIKKKSKDNTDQTHNSEGTISFEFLEKENKEDFDLDAYDYNLAMGKVMSLDGTPDVPKDYMGFFEPDIDTMKLSELSIFNSTDYLRAIYDFENLVDPVAILGHDMADEKVFDSAEWALKRQKAIQSLIMNSTNTYFNKLFIKSFRNRFSQRSLTNTRWTYQTKNRTFTFFLYFTNSNIFNYSILNRIKSKMSHI